MPVWAMSTPGPLTETNAYARKRPRTVMRLNTPPQLVCFVPEHLTLPKDSPVSWRARHSASLIQAVLESEVLPWAETQLPLGPTPPF